MEEFPASKVHIQPVQPDLPGGFPADVCPHITGQFRCGRNKGGGGGVVDRKLVVANRRNSPL